MPTYTYEKLCNVGTLSMELVYAGFACLGCTCNGDPNNPITKVDLPPAETKDPSAIVEAHVYTVDEPIDWRIAYAAALATFNDASTAFTGAEDAYIAALQQYNNAGTTATKLTAQQAEISAMKDGMLAAKQAIAALRSVVMYMAKDTGIEDAT